MATQIHQIRYPLRNPVQVSYTQSSNPLGKVEYSRKAANAVKWFGIIQLLLAFFCVVFQAIATAFQDHFINTVSSFNLYEWPNVAEVDELATGIWMGLVMAITSVIGLVAFKQKRKSLIISHLVLNLFVTILSPGLTGTSAISISEISYCRRSGISISMNGFWTSKDIPRVDIYGEILFIDLSRCTTTPACRRYPNRSFENRFYCKHAIFRAWIASECILLVSSVMMFIVSLSLLVISSKAACLSCCSRCCCRGCSQSCVGCCCDDSFSTPVSLVVYQPQPFVAQTITDGLPAVQSNSQSSVQTVHPNFMYNQATFLQTANQEVSSIFQK